jgi:hypothetical protein
MESIAKKRRVKQALSKIRTLLDLCKAVTREANSEAIAVESTRTRIKHVLMNFED